VVLLRLLSILTNGFWRKGDARLIMLVLRYRVELVVSNNLIVSIFCYNASKAFVFVLLLFSVQFQVNAGKLVAFLHVIKHIPQLLIYSTSVDNAVIDLYLEDAMGEYLGVTQTPLINLIGLIEVAC